MHIGEIAFWFVPPKNQGFPGTGTFLRFIFSPNIHNGIKKRHNG